MTMPPRAPRANLSGPSVALLSALITIGAGVWLAAFINAGIAAFLAAVIALFVGLVAGAAAMDLVAEERHRRRAAEADDYNASVYAQAQRATVSEHQKALQLSQTEGKLLDAEAEIVRLRAQLENATVKEGDHQ
jgi:hypothetical protein